MLELIEASPNSRITVDFKNFKNLQNILQKFFVQLYCTVNFTEESTDYHLIKAKKEKRIKL